MAGHSKWANTKRRKATQDEKKGKIFSKIIRELVSATQMSGGDPACNPRLRSAIDRALSNNMTRDTLNRAIARGLGDINNKNIETVIYEGYGPDGIAIMIECLSDNRNRTVSKVRCIFNKFDFHLSASGSVSYLFNKKGIISFKQGDETFITEIALEADAEDIIVHNNGIINIHTAWDKITSVCNLFESAGLKADSAIISMIPTSKIKISIEVQLKLSKLINLLKNYDEVQEVYHNAVTS